MHRIPLALAIAFLLFGCGPKPFVQKSASMEPTVMAEETIHARMGAYRSKSPQRWDVVVFTPPRHSASAASTTDDLGRWIFRIVGLPGDIISFDETGLLINGSIPTDRPSWIQNIPYKQSTAVGVSYRRHSPSYPFTVPDGHYFVLGDNADQAYDSRIWGPLARESILGKVENK